MSTASRGWTPWCSSVVICKQAGLA